MLTEADDISAEEVMSLVGELSKDEAFLKIMSSQEKGEEPQELDEIVIPNAGLAAIPVVLQDLEKILENTKDNKWLQQQSPKAAINVAKVHRWLVLQRTAMGVAIDKISDEMPVMPKLMKKLSASIIKSLMTGKSRKAKLTQRATAFLGPNSASISLISWATKWLSWFTASGATAFYLAFAKADPKKYEEFMNGLREYDVEAYKRIEEKYPAATVTKYLEEMRKEYKKKGEEFPPEEPEDPTFPEDDDTEEYEVLSLDPDPDDEPKKPMFSYVGKR